MVDPDLHLYYIKNFIQSQILIKIKIECNIKHNKMLYNIFSKVVKMAVTSNHGGENTVIAYSPANSLLV